MYPAVVEKALPEAVVPEIGILQFQNCFEIRRNGTVHIKWVTFFHIKGERHILQIQCR